MSFRELEDFAAISLLEELDFAMVLLLDRKVELLLDPIASLQDDEGAELLLDFAELELDFAFAELDFPLVELLDRSLIGVEDDEVALVEDDDLSFWELELELINVIEVRIFKFDPVILRSA